MVRIARIALALLLGILLLSGLACDAARESTPTPTPTPTPYIPGDANEDGDVNSLDIAKVMRIIMELDEPTPGADANEDGNINALDITAIELIIMWD